MGLEESDRVRRIEDITIFKGWAIQQQVLQPGVNVSTCTGFYSPSTILKFNTYNYANKVTTGRGYFITCQDASR
jgi:hypothetical protein